jgi:hypothetical protein
VKVCFVCCGTPVLDGHNVCSEHHNAAYCRKCRNDFRQGSGYVRKAKTPTTKSIYKPQCFDALRRLGGRANATQIGNETGLTGNQVRAGLMSAKGVHYERNPEGEKPGGVWVLDEAA